MNELERLIAKDKIETQLNLYCKGVDERDWSLVRSCFGDGHVHRHPPFIGTIDQFIGFASATMAEVKMTHHSLSNVIINLSDNGMSAHSEVNFNAVHFVEASAKRVFSFEMDDGDIDWQVVGTYKDKWVCKDGVWLIVDRTSHHCWERLQSANPIVRKQ